jgi:glutaredoxin 3
LTEFFVIELDEVEDGDAIQAYLAQKTGQRTVPNIFIKQQHIGGCDDLLRIKASGQLQKLLA